MREREGGREDTKKIIKIKSLQLISISVLPRTDLKLICHAVTGKVIKSILLEAIDDLFRNYHCV